MKMNQQKEENSKEIVDLINLQNQRKMRQIDKIPKIRSSQTIIAQYPDPSFKTPLVLGPGRYNWEYARDAFTSNNSNKNVPLFKLQDRTDHRSIDAIKGPVHKKINFDNPYESLPIKQRSIESISLCSRSKHSSH